MSWFWHVRIYNKQGDYRHGQIETGRDLREIDTVQDFYRAMTGCKMLLEGMSEIKFDRVAMINESFDGLWCQQSKGMV